MSPTGVPPISPLDPTDARTIPPFDIRGRLGAGGMGVVYAALAPDGRWVAVKVIRPEFAADPDFRQRFAREVQLMSRVRARCIAPVLAFDTEAAQPWFATAFLSGPTLHERVQHDGALAPATTRVLAAGMAEAIAAIHAAGVVHRDLKPSNVILAPDGPKVLDFGIARALDGTHLTRTGGLVGSPGWMGPERFRGATGPETDVFSWGALVAYAATGRPPFGTGSAEELMYRLLQEEPDLQGVPGPLREQVAGALAKDPAARPTAGNVVRELTDGAARASASTPDEMATAVGTLIDRDWTPPRVTPTPPAAVAMAPPPAPVPLQQPATGPGPVVPPPTAPPGHTSPQQRRRVGLVVGAAAVTVVLVGGLIGWLVLRGNEAGGDVSTAGGGTGDEGAGGGVVGEPVELTFASWGSDERHAATQEVIDLFEAENPDIRITGNFSDWGSYWDQLSTSFAAADSPDIITQETSYLREFAERGTLADLQEFSDVLDLSGVDPTVADSGTVDGQLLGVPAGVDTYTIVADPAAFTEAGVDMPDDDSWTWDEYVDIATQISEATDGEIAGAQSMAYNAAGFSVFARQRGEQLFDENGALGFSPETLTEWFAITAELVDSGAQPEVSGSDWIEPLDPSESLLASNTGAMAHFWSQQVDGLTDSSGRDLELLRYPGETEADRTGMAIRPIMFYSVAAGSEHPEEAARFVDFLLNSEDAAQIILAERGLPANPSVRESVLDALSDEERQSAEFVSRIEDTVVDAEPPHGVNDVNGWLRPIADELSASGQITPEEAAEQFIEELETAMGL